MADNTSTFMELTASIVSAYVRHNSVPSAELPALIGQVHTALTRATSGHAKAAPPSSVMKSRRCIAISLLQHGSAGIGRLITAGILVFGPSRLILRERQ
jgi:predicted transcriptional regulator